MKKFRYYSTGFNRVKVSKSNTLDNREVLSAPLVVNCAGRCSTNDNVINSVPNGRLDYHLIYVVSGELSIHLNDKYCPLGAGSVFIFPAKTGYSYANFGSNELNYLWVHFTGNQVLSILNKYGIDFFPKIYHIGTNNSIQQRFQRLFECFSKKDKYMEDDLSASLHRLIIEIGRAIDKAQNEKISLSESIRYINEFYTNHIKITELARMEKMCMTAYNLHFKKQIGMSPTKYILKLRMETAMELLETSNFSIKQIGLICGYTDYNFFSRAFKQYVGLTPSVFKNKIRNNKS